MKIKLNKNYLQKFYHIDVSGRTLHTLRDRLLQEFASISALIANGGFSKRESKISLA
ncbi:hypothetical protein [Chlorogloeopsis sp. ULAP02]|uniref:hypothetical protein n=1 Tax=Chlorogloeopsis sp. ULAP02 TaxID=3107926 RepID=UPI003135E19F